MLLHFNTKGDMGMKMFGREQYAEMNALLSKKIEQKKALIAVHRGS